MAIEEAFPGVVGCSGIGEKGRSKSFEITLLAAGETEGELLWTGLKKGPPRKLKFPDPDKVVEMLELKIQRKD